MKNRESFCTFRVGELRFGVEVRQVQEVLRHQKTTSVPLAHSVVEGLMNLRGQIVTAIDLRKRLDLPEQDGAVALMNVVIRTEDEPISILVDEIGDVVQVDSEAFEIPPETLGAEQRKLIRGTYKLEHNLLLILDTAKVVDLAA